MIAAYDSGALETVLALTKLGDFCTVLSLFFLDIDNIESQAFVIESMSVNNNWKDDSDGKAYLQGFGDGSQRFSIQERMESDILPHFKEKLKRELAGKAPPKNARTNYPNRNRG